MSKEKIIQKYLNKKLSTSEQKQFDTWMKNDEKFKNEVMLQEGIQAVIAKEEGAKMKERLKKVESKIVNKGKNTIRRIVLIIVGLVLLFLAYKGYQNAQSKNTPEGIFAANFEAYPNIYYPVTRGKTDLMTQAFMAYENADYKVAAERIEEQLQTSSALELKFYQAMSYANLGNYPLAIRRLEDIRRFQSQYNDECYWYLGLIYMKQSNYPLAIERFQTFYEVSNEEDKKEVARKSIYLLQSL